MSYIGWGTASLGIAPSACKYSPTHSIEPTASMSWTINGRPAWDEPATPIVFGKTNELATAFEARDALILPKGFRYQIVAQWGDNFGPAGNQIRFGYNCDYTGLVPISGRRDEFYLFVNHEEISARPWLEGAADVLDLKVPEFKVTLSDDGPQLSVDGVSFVGRSINMDVCPADLKIRLRETAAAVLDELGVSILHVKRQRDGHFKVVADSNLHKRISPIRTKTSGRITPRPALFSGPAGAILTEPIRGTFGNCSGATTPWGTFLTCEENIDNHVDEFVKANGDEIQYGQRFDVSFKVTPERKSKLPSHLLRTGTCLSKRLDGRHYGWVCEVDPRTTQLTKHTALGRFRHENVALRAEHGQPLMAYMGDDRRGGHVWRYVSHETVADPSDTKTSQLLSNGTLYAARFDANFKGSWVALELNTPLVVPKPELTGGGHLWLPNRPGGGHVAVGNKKAQYAQVTVDQWLQSIEEYTQKPFETCTLRDLVEGNDVERLAVIHLDAFAMANAIGATPSARPEDLEVHPQDGSIYIAFTDAITSLEGSPSRIVFPEAVDPTSKRYGCVMRLDDLSNQDNTFTWGRFIQSGELADGGAGFACPDNLIFDKNQQLWIVCDVSTGSLNDNSDGSEVKPGSSVYQGVFGNNSIFMVPTSGPSAGVPALFAVAPCEAELTGPTFSADCQSLILSVQHPGELHGTRTDPVPDTIRPIRLRDRQGNYQTQQRKVPIGSNFPSKQLGDVPRPSVVCITRTPFEEQLT